MPYRRSINDIVEIVKDAKDRGKGCNLLIGAGCSVTAGVPSAAGFVKIIEEKYDSAYSRAKIKTYPACLAELTLSQRRDLIASYVDAAQINWAHICMALLIKSGYVDRVLTTNFDLLAVRACALLGEFPAIYDIAASQLFKPADIPDKAVFYLHGQRTGFILINTEADFHQHLGLLGPVFEDAGRGQVWIVVGYSGESDPVFEHLAGVPLFDKGLFWIGYKNSEPARHVRDRLLHPGKGAFLTSGFDADAFFITLTQKLEIFPPDFIRKPFTHLDQSFALLTPYPIPGQSAAEGVTHTPRSWIKNAIQQYEDKVVLDVSGEVSGEVLDTPGFLNVAANFLMMAGKYDAVVGLKEHYEKTPSPELAETLAWAFIMQANTLNDQAKTKDRSEADQLWQLAGDKCQAALEIKPDLHAALNNWGLTLYRQAITKSGDEADRLLQLAGDKYQAALQIKSDKHEALNNWGIALGDQAKTKAGPEADQLWQLAGEKYQAVLEIKPNLHEALNNWGNDLYNQAKTKDGPEADRLWQLAGEKYQAALAIKPNLHEALYNWGSALSDQAKTKSGDEADRLFQLAGEKYQAAIEIKPDMHVAPNNWGLALLNQAQKKSGHEADQLFDQSLEKLSRAEAIKPGSGSYNLACLSALRGNAEECRTWLQKAKQYGTLPYLAHLQSDSDLDRVREQSWFQEFLETLS